MSLQPAGPAPFSRQDCWHGDRHCFLQILKGILGCFSQWLLQSIWYLSIGYLNLIFLSQHVAWICSVWKARGYLGRLGCADRVKLKAEELRFTAGETFHSRYPLHVFQTNPQTPRTCREGKVVLILSYITPLCHHPGTTGVMSLASNAPNLCGSVSALPLSRSIRWNFLPCLSSSPVKCRWQRLLLFGKLHQPYGEKKAALMVGSNTAIFFFFSFTDSALRDFL